MTFHKSRRACNQSRRVGGQLCLQRQRQQLSGRVGDPRQSRRDHQPAIAQRAFNSDPTDMARGQGVSGQYAYGSFEPPTGYIINDTLAINNNVYPYFYWILELGGVTAKLELENYDGNPDNPDQRYKWLSTSAFAGQTISASNPLKIKCFTLNDLQENTTVAAIRIDGQLLIDNAFPAGSDQTMGCWHPQQLLSFPNTGFDCLKLVKLFTTPMSKSLKTLTQHHQPSPLMVVNGVLTEVAGSIPMNSITRFFSWRLGRCLWVRQRLYAVGR